jgi:hypothetical protein
MAADVRLSILDQIQIASPCHMRWEDMDRIGEDGDRTRHCRECSLNVHNISDMTRDEAERFLRESLCGSRADDPAHRVCGSFFQRDDGTILTKDCPVGLAAIREKARRTVSRALAATVFAATSAIAWASRSTDADVRALQPFATLIAWLTPDPPMRQVQVQGSMIAGRIAVPRAPNPPPQRHASITPKDY